MQNWRTLRRKYNLKNLVILILQTCKCCWSNELFILPKYWLKLFPLWPAHKFEVVNLVLSRGERFLLTRLRFDKVLAKVRQHILWSSFIYANNVNCQKVSIGLLLCHVVVRAVCLLCAVSDNVQHSV